MNLLLQGDCKGAGREHGRLLEIFKVLFIMSNPIPVKYAVSRVGFQVGTPRLPLVPIDKATAAEVDQVVAQYSVDLKVR